MDTINRTLKYVDLNLIHTLEDIKEYSLPPNYKFVFFSPGDEIDYVNIEVSAGEFLNFEEGKIALNHYFKNYDKLTDMCVFIENENKEKIAAATAVIIENPTDDITGFVDLVSVKKEYQGLGLSKPLVTEVLKIFKKLGHKKITLHTQTHTWLAVKVYLDLGFTPYNIEESYLGWQIIKNLTNHEKLKKIKNINNNMMYENLYIQAYDFLYKNYNKPFSYKVWDKKGPIIGICKDNKLDFYKYSFENNKLKILDKNDKYKDIFYKQLAKI